MTRVGWIGLGAMGGPMAACAARAGHELRAFDIDPERVPDGVEPADSAADAAREADVLALMVATPEQAEQALSDAAPDDWDDRARDGHRRPGAGHPLGA